MRHIITKRFENLKAAHRQWKHPGHCSFAHGENWAFEISFSCEKLDPQGFVVDFGHMKGLKTVLDHWFDHTLLIDNDDPELETLKELHSRKIVDLRAVPACSAEGLAMFVYYEAQRWASDVTDGRVSCIRVVCFEDNKNSATFIPQ